ncbi:MAG: methyltransferase domain-containing protein [Bacteroidota bacterium]
MAVSSTLKSILLPADTWSLDVDLRYLPVVRFLKKHFPGASLLEVGSSSTGITPYVNSMVIGADATFPDPLAKRLIPVVTRYPLPFRDESFDVVISLDTFEHVPRDFRQGFITEMLRTARRYVIIGFPEGQAAEDHDAAMERYFSRQHGTPHPYFVEHRQYKVPKEGEFEQYVHHACGQLGKSVRMQRQKNVNIHLRSMFMRLVWHRWKALQRMYIVATAFSRWDWLFHMGTCYRSIYYLELNERH